MNPAPANDPAEPTGYTLDIVAELTDVSSQTILHYQEQGLTRPGGEDAESRLRDHYQYVQ